MPAKATPTRKQIIQQSLAALDGPTPLNDVVEHHLTLESIQPPERGTQYPRIVPTARQKRSARSE